ncbi:FAD:protein FMN transferase [Microbacterium sp. NPDC055903]
MPVWRFEAIGTVWEIESVRELTDAERRAVTVRIDGFDREWSRFRDDSSVSELARRGGAVERPADAVVMLDAYRELSAATAGAVQPLIGASLEALGYDADYSLRAGEPVSAPQGWEEIVDWAGDELVLTRPALLDVGALGKGRLVDAVQEVLAEVPGELVVDAGGDIAVRGEIRIALEHPYDPAKAIGVATVRDGALCASAVNRRSWGDGLHHVLDARTGLPVRTWAATWTMAQDAMQADAVATALFFDGGPELAARWGVEWVRMSTDGRAQRSLEAPVELFTAPSRE